MELQSNGKHIFSEDADEQPEKQQQPQQRQRQRKQEQYQLGVSNLGIDLVDEEFGTRDK